jgi:hypothetical protein
MFCIRPGGIAQKHPVYHRILLSLRVLLGVRFLAQSAKNTPKFLNPAFNPTIAANPMFVDPA